MIGVIYELILVARSGTPRYTTDGLGETQPPRDTSFPQVLYAWQACRPPNLTLTACGHRVNYLITSDKYTLYAVSPDGEGSEGSSPSSRIRAKKKSLPPLELVWRAPAVTGKLDDDVEPVT